MKAAVAAAAVAVLALTWAIGPWSASAAAASRPFTPELEVSASNYRASEHPQLTVTIQKRRDGFHDDPSFYDEQDLQEAIITLPPGLSFNPRGQQRCELRAAEGRDYCTNPQAKIGSAELDVEVWVKLFRGTNPPQVPPEIDQIFPDISDLAVPLCLPTITASIYNETPSPGELARTVTIIETTSISQVTICGFEQFPISVGEIDLPSFSLSSAATLGADAMVPVIATKQIPNAVAWQGASAPVPLSISRLSMTLDGDKGSEQGFPLISNPTSCEPRSATAVFTSYGDDDVPSPDDRQITDSADYPVTDCGVLPYAPRATLTLDLATPFGQGSLRHVLEQRPGEVATSSVTLSMPPTFRPNPGRALEICSDGQIAARACPYSSRLGTTTVHTRLWAQPLSGFTYMGPAVGDRVRVVTFLEGPISMKVEGTLWQRPDGGIDSVMSGLPDIQLERLTYVTPGNGQGSFLTPTTCGTHTVLTTATSRDGRVAALRHPLEIAGCLRRATTRWRRLQARLWPAARKRRARLHLLVKQDPAVRPGSIKFRVAGGLRWRLAGQVRKRLASHARRRALGTVRIVPEEGLPIELDLFPRASRKRRLLLRTRSRRYPIAVRVSKKRGGGATSITLNRLPKRSTHDIALRLFGTRGRLVSTPRRCRRASRVTATITDADATRARLTASWSPGCARPRSPR